MSTPSVAVVVERPNAGSCAADRAIGSVVKVPSGARTTRPAPSRPTKKRPDRSWSSARTTSPLRPWCLPNVVAEPSRSRTAPLSTVPSQRPPSRSSYIARTRSSGRPFAVVSVSTRSPRMRPTPAPSVPNQMLPSLSWRITLTSAAGMPSAASNRLMPSRRSPQQHAGAADPERSVAIDVERADRTCGAMSRLGASAIEPWLNCFSPRLVPIRMLPSRALDERRHHRVERGRVERVVPALAVRRVRRHAADVAAPDRAGPVLENRREVQADRTARAHRPHRARRGSGTRRSAVRIHNDPSRPARRLEM